MDPNPQKGTVSRIRTLDTDSPGTVLVLCGLGICVVIGIIAFARHRSVGPQASTVFDAWPRYMEPEYRQLTEYEKRQRAVQMMNESEDEVLRMLDEGGE